MKFLEKQKDNERQLALQNKKKHDKEIELRKLHFGKKRELIELEAKTCLEKLQEIDKRIKKGQQNYTEKQEERKAFLKT